MSKSKIIKMSSKIEIENQRVFQNQISAGRNSKFSNENIVAGRVISENSEGTFDVSVAGQKINVRSNVHLAENQIFSARAAVKNGTVYLSLINDSSLKNASKTDFVSKFTSESSGGKLNNSASVFLQSLGIEPIPEAFHLFQLMQTMRIKIDVNSVQQTLNTAKKFSDDEKDEAAQISFLLENKGLKSSEKTVKAVVQGFSSEKQGQRQGDNSNNRKNFDLQSKESDFDGNSARNLFKNYLDSVDSACASNKIGALTAFNSFKSKNASGNCENSHWIILPFEWKSQNCVGDIRVFLDDNLRNLQKIVINCKKNVQKLVFSLYFKNKKVESLKFSFDFPVSLKRKTEYSDLLFEMLKKSGCGSGLKSVEFAEFDEIKDFCSGDEIVATVRGLA